MKFWIGFGGNPIFSKKDRPILLIVPADGNHEQNLSVAQFVEADTPVEARAKLKAVIDGYFDKMDHIVELEKLIVVRDKQRDAWDRETQSMSDIPIDDVPRPK